MARVADQNPEFLQLVEREGLKPGSELTVESRSEAADSLVFAGVTGHRSTLGFRAAAKIFVEKIGRSPEG